MRRIAPLAALLLLACAALAGCQYSQAQRNYYAGLYPQELDNYPNSLLTYDTGLSQWTFNNQDVNVKLDLEQGKDDDFGLRLTNNTDRPVTILWNRVVYKDVNGDQHHVIHHGVNYWDLLSTQAPTQVPAGGSLDDLLQPARLVWRDGGPRFAPLQKDDTPMPGVWGQEARLAVPMIVNGVTKVYRFALDLSSPPDDVYNDWLARP